MYRSMMMLGLLMLSTCPSSLTAQYPLTVTDVADCEVVFQKQS
ncbi:hypothetical protein [Shewanella atlantica]|nr:hypothetical protein [Shewanella atlantica]